jgi:2-methylcitrate dehydratase PrpD
VEATVAMRERLLARTSIEDIAAVRVETHDLALPLVNYRPQTTLGAKFSMPHAIAAAIVTGTGGAPAFAADTLAEPAIGRLRERVTMAPWAPALAPPNDRPARVIVELRDGSRIEGECLSAAGGPDRPLPLDTVLGKMSSLAAPVYPGIRPVFEDLVRMTPQRMSQGWAGIVGEFCD